MKVPNFATPPTVSREMTFENERRNSILMTGHYPDLGSASNWSGRVGNLIQPIRVGTRHQCGISELVSLTSFRRERSGGVANCRLFSQATCRAVNWAFVPFFEQTIQGLSKDTFPIFQVLQTVQKEP